MDTNLPSPNRTSSTDGSIVTGIFSTVLSVGAVLWVIGGAAGVATAQSASTPVHAAPVQAATVGFSDLDLSTTEGARALLRRINVAAHEACGTSVHSPLLPRAAVQHDRCVVAATESALNRIDSPMVAQVHRTESAGTLLAAR